MNHNGQAQFITPLIARIENSELWSHARPRGSIDRPLHAPTPETDQDRQRREDYVTHATARAGAARRDAQEAHARQIAATQSKPAPIMPTANSDALRSLQAEISHLSEIIRSMSERIDTLEGAGFNGGVS